MSYTKAELSQLNRKELQKLCKHTGVKANKKTWELIDCLAEYFLKAESDLKEMEEELKEYDQLELNTTWTLDECENGDQADNNEGENKGEYNNEGDNNEGESNEGELKASLMKEVERRAEEKLSKIPRFVVDNLVIPTVSAEPTTPVDRVKSYGVKMDSIDKYLEKKTKRAEKQISYSSRLKENKIPMRASKSTSSLKTASQNRRKSVKVDDEVTVNFSSDLKSPKVLRVSPRLSVMNLNRPKPVIMPPRKSVQPTGNKVQGARSRKSFGMAALSSPSFCTGKSQTPKGKTPFKFDLKASLKKPLGYKPHGGKLKEVYFTQPENVILPRSLAQKAEEKAEEKKVPLKMKKSLSTMREKRRQDASEKRGKQRENMLDKRRGITS